MRIVSLLPSATESLFAIGAGDDVVGVTHECDFPPAARTRPALTRSLLPEELQTAAGGEAAAIDRHVRRAVHEGSSLYALDEERLAALAPDLIVTQELCAVCAVSYEIVAQAARRLGPQLISLEPASYEDVRANIALLGSLTGYAAGAERVLAAMRERELRLRARAAAGRRPRVLVLEWTDPPMSGGHWTSDLVALAGGDAILANPHANSRVLTWEAIAAADPDVTIVAPCGFGLAQTQRAYDEAVANGAPLGTSRAARTGRLWLLDGNAFLNRPGPRLIDTAELIAAAIRGEDAAPASLARAG